MRAVLKTRETKQRVDSEEEYKTKGFPPPDFFPQELEWGIFFCTYFTGCSANPI